MTTDEGKEIHGSTKKVKKRKADNNANIVTDEPNNKEVNNDDKSLREPKKKKRKKEKSDCKNGDMKTQNHEEVCEEIPPTLSKKKKKKKKKKREDPEADVDDLQDAVHAPESAGKKKKKKKDKHKHDKDKDCSEPERDGEKCNVDVVEAQQFVEEPCRKKKSKYKHKDGEKSEESSHKKKHKIKHDCTTSPVELDTNTDIECQPSESSSNNCKKKKKKKRKYEDDDVEQTEDGLSVHDSQVDGKKKKKKKKNHESKHIADHNTMVDNSIVSNGLLHTSQEVDHDEDTPKLKKKKTHIGTDTDDSNKSYNSLPFDYNSIDNRQCKELTKSQSLDNHNEGTGQNQGVASLDAKSGQWGTASFENKEREQKFLRLLGGFKKGGSTASKPLFGKLGKLGGGCALNREEEASLNVKLETEFDRALSFKLSKKKSGGLGFQAPPGEGKKFYIDKTSSKSIKFNDSD